MTLAQHAQLSSSVHDKDDTDLLVRISAEIIIDPSRRQKVRRRMHYLTGMAAIGGFLFGYDTGKQCKDASSENGIASNHVTQVFFLHVLLSIRCH